VPVGQFPAPAAGFEMLGVNEGRDGESFVPSWQQETGGDGRIGGSMDSIGTWLAVSFDSNVTMYFNTEAPDQEDPTSSSLAEAERGITPAFHSTVLSPGMLDGGDDSLNGWDDSLLDGVFRGTYWGGYFENTFAG